MTNKLKHAYKQTTEEGKQLKINGTYNRNKQANKKCALRVTKRDVTHDEVCHLFTPVPAHIHTIMHIVKPL